MSSGKRRPSCLGLNGLTRGGLKEKPPFAGDVFKSIILPSNHCILITMDLLHRSHDAPFLSDALWNLSDGSINLKSVLVQELHKKSDPVTRRQMAPLGHNESNNDILFWSTTMWTDINIKVTSLEFVVNLSWPRVRYVVLWLNGSWVTWWLWVYFTRNVLDKIIIGTPMILAWK